MTAASDQALQLSLYHLEDHGVDFGNPIHYGVAHSEACGCAVDPSIELPCLRVGSNGVVEHGTYPMRGVLIRYFVGEGVWVVGVVHCGIAARIVVHVVTD